MPANDIQNADSVNRKLAFYNPFISPYLATLMGFPRRKQT